MAEVAGCKAICTDTDLTEQGFSSVERDVYEIFIVGIWRIHPSFSTAVLKSMKPKVNIFDRKKKNAISTSGFQDKLIFYILVILLMFVF